MGNLIIKDLVSYWKSITLVIVLYVVFTIAPNIPGEAYLIMGTYLIGVQVAYLEDKNNTLQLFKILPLKPSILVLSKYLSTLIVTVFFLGIGIPHILIYNPAYLFEFITAISATLLMVGIFLALFFFKGYQKAYVTSIFMFLAIFFGLVIPQFKNRLIFKMSLHGWDFALYVIVVLAIYFLTSLIAIRFFKAMEIK